MKSFDLRKMLGIPAAGERIAALGLRPDLTKAAVTMVTDERSHQEIVRFDSELTPTETVIMVIEVRRNKKIGLLALTTERLLYRQHGSASGGVETVPLGDVVSVEDGTKGSTGRVDVHTADAVLAADQILGTQASKFAATLRRQLADPGQPVVLDPVQEMIDLRARRAAGTIGDAEFRLEKARLLDEL